MKKIIALILALCCVFLMISCGETTPPVDGTTPPAGDGTTPPAGDGTTPPVDETTAGIEAFKKLYSMSEPTKVVTTQVTDLGSVTLKGGSTLVTGALNDGRTATVYTYSYEVLQSVQEGAGDVITPIMGTPISGSREYVEGMGERYDGGEWDEEGFNFAPRAGFFGINLDASKLVNCTYASSGELQSLSFSVKAENVAAVFGESASQILSDVDVVITANSAVVTGISISYYEILIPEDEDLAYPEASVTISTVYSYSIEKVTLTK